MAPAFKPVTHREKASYAIQAGPNKLNLMLALFDSTQMFSRPVSFTVLTKTMWANAIHDDRDAFYLQHNVVIGITSVSKEDGSGESWNIQGRVNPIVEDLWRGYTSVEIFYDTRSRTGHLKFCHHDPLPPTFPGTGS